MRDVCLDRVKAGDLPPTPQATSSSPSRCPMVKIHACTSKSCLNHVDTCSKTFLML